MEEFFVRVWQELVGRAQAPMKFRLILQPLTAIILAVRAGKSDARHNKPPFLWALIFHKELRRSYVQSAWKDTGKLLAAVFAVDVVYQFVFLRTVYLGEALIVAIFVGLIPYMIVRPLVTRLAARLRRKADGPGDN